MDDFTRARLERIFIVIPFSWIYYSRNPLVFAAMPSLSN
jgi:hypothetical protein